MSWKILRPMLGVVKGSRRKLCNEELRDFYSSPNNTGNIIKHKMKGEGAMQVVVGKPVGKRELGRHWRR
jgi:hypothetical protein